MATLLALFIGTWTVMVVFYRQQRCTLHRIESTLYTVKSTIATLGVNLMAKFDELTAQVTALSDGFTTLTAAVVESGADIDTILANTNPQGGLTEAEATALMEQLSAVQTKQADAIAQAQAVAAKFPVVPPPA